MLKIGQRVIDRWQEKGTINETYDNFDMLPWNKTFMAFGFPYTSMSGQDWLEQQILPFTEKNLEEHWYQVLCDSGGAILSCESCLETI